MHLVALTESIFVDRLPAQVLKEHQLPIPLMGLPDAVSMAFLGKCVTQNVLSEAEKTGWMRRVNHGSFENRGIETRFLADAASF